MNKVEEWRAVPGFEGYYEVSNRGRVKSLAREIVYRDGDVHRQKERIMRLRLAGPKRNYLFVGLARAGGSMPISVHRLVAWAFIGEQLKGYHVHHLNADTMDNRVENLTYKPEGEHVSQHNKGSNNYSAILTEAEVTQIKIRLQDEMADVGKLAKEFGVGKGIIYHIRDGRNWKGIGSDVPKRTTKKRVLSDEERKRRAEHMRRIRLPKRLAGGSGVHPHGGSEQPYKPFSQPDSEYANVQPAEYRADWIGA